VGSATTTLDADARDLLQLAASVLADRACWSRDARAAMRWRRVSRKPVHMAPEHAYPDGYRKIACSARDVRATEWSLIGALELVADYPDGPEVVRAIDMLIGAARGWTPSRVEGAGHCWVLWTLAVALVCPAGVVLVPRGSERFLEVDLKAERAEIEPAPPTVRSSELRFGAQAA